MNPVQKRINKERHFFYGGEYLSVTEATRHLPFTGSTIRRFIRDGKIQASNISNGQKPIYLIHKNELKKLVPKNIRDGFTFEKK